MTSFTEDLKSALDDAIRSRSPQLDREVLSNIGLTGSEYVGIRREEGEDFCVRWACSLRDAALCSGEWEAAHLRPLRYEFKECMRLVIAIKESVSEQMHESQVIASTKPSTLRA